MAIALSDANSVMVDALGGIFVVEHQGCVQSVIRCGAVHFGFMAEEVETVATGQRPRIQLEPLFHKIPGLIDEVDDARPGHGFVHRHPDRFAFE